MFEQATRERFRYDTVRGLITTEDLWAMPLSKTKDDFCLDSVARKIFDQIEDSRGKSFVTKKSKTDKVLKAKLEVVKVVIEYKLDEIKRATLAAENKNKKDQILGIIVEKQTEDLKAMDIKKLRKMVKNL